RRNQCPLCREPLQPARMPHRAERDLAIALQATDRRNQGRLPSRFRTVGGPCFPCRRAHGGRVDSVPSEGDRMSRFAFETPWFLLLLLLLPLLLVVLRFTLVDSPRAQLALATTTRCVILLLLALALGSLLWVSRSHKLSLLLLGDLSDSVADSAPAQ